VAKAARELLRGKNTIPVHAGRRNGFLAALSGYLAAQFPFAGGVSQLFEGVGWDLFNVDGKYPLDAFETMIGRFQDKEQAGVAAAQAEREAERARIISELSGGERDFTITEDEIAHLVEVFGPHWIQFLFAIRKRDIYVLRPDGSYDPDPVMRDTVFVAARDRLAVFGDYVEYDYEDEKGTHRKSISTFLEEYATVVRHVVFDLANPRGGYDAKTQTIYLAAAPPQVDPVEHPEIQRWLEHHDTHLIDMIATMPHLSKMLPALVLTGTKGAGKTLLAIGVGQIYGRSCLDADAALGQFNASMLSKQPIIFMDEKAASAYEREGTTLIRKFVTQGVRQLDEKFQARVELLGYPRLIVAANNADVLATAQDMSTEDREAFAERLVHIDMDAGKDHLARQPHIQTYWLDRRWLAEHIFWLSKNWEVQHPGRRFAVANNNTALHDGLASKSGSASDVACWLLRYVTNPNTAKHLPISFDGGILRVNSGAIIQGWSIYLDGHSPPSPSKISRALRSLASTRQKIKWVQGGTQKRVNAYQIDPRLLRASNETHGLVDDFDKLFGLET
jgi:hypothetical protein